jgi:predicted nuclease of predicted toxin-antitoxin system
MNLLADESVDRPIVVKLRADGHTVDYIAELAPSIDDDEVLRLANDRNALLLTEDKDFGELVFRLRRVHSGVVLLRLTGMTSAAKADTVAQVLQEREGELVDAFTVISSNSVRVRHLS